MPPAYLKGPDVARKPSGRTWCDGKATFHSPALAATVAKRSFDKVRTHYHCPTCGLWHLGGASAEPPLKGRHQFIRSET